MQQHFWGNPLWKTDTKMGELFNICLTPVLKLCGEGQTWGELSGDPNPQYFLKSTAVQMGGVLPYKWEVHSTTNRRCTVGLPFLQGLQARKVQRYKGGSYCRTNRRCTAVLLSETGRGWGFGSSSESDFCKSMEAWHIASVTQFLLHMTVHELHVLKKLAGCCAPKQLHVFIQQSLKFT